MIDRVFYCVVYWGLFLPIVGSPMDQQVYKGMREGFEHCSDKAAFFLDGPFAGKRRPLSKQLFFLVVGS